MKQLIQQVQENVIRAKNLYQEFRLYDFASYSINYLTPKDTFEKEEHLAYGLKARNRLDLYRTKNPKKQKPLIVFVHGGSWQHGNKRDYLFIGETFAREGFDVAVINYQLAPEQIFPAFVDDYKNLSLLNSKRFQHVLHIQKSPFIWNIFKKIISFFLLFTPKIKK